MLDQLVAEVRIVSGMIDISDKDRLALPLAIVLAVISRLCGVVDRLLLDL